MSLSHLALLGTHLDRPWGGLQRFNRLYATIALLRRDKDEFDSDLTRTTTTHPRVDADQAKSVVAETLGLRAL